MAFIKFSIGLLIFFVAIGALTSIGAFFIDVMKWHDPEEKVKIKPSNDVESEVNTSGNDTDIADNDRINAGESDTSAFSAPWLQS